LQPVRLPQTSLSGQGSRAPAPDPAGSGKAVSDPAHWQLNYIRK